jgi:hypothetical protein
MIDRLRDFVIGTSEEREARKKASQLGQLRQKNNREERAFRSNRNISRRLFARQLALGLGLVAIPPAGIYVASQITKPAPAEFRMAPAPTTVTKSKNTLGGRLPEGLPIGVRDFEEVYQLYLSGFEKVAPFDAEASKGLSFLKERRMQAVSFGGRTTFDLRGAPNFHVFTVIADAIQSPELLPAIGFASTATLDQYYVMFLRNEPVNEIWAGSVAAHETKHVMQRFANPSRTVLRKSIEQAEREHEAYSLQFRILDGYTQGKFYKALDEALPYLPADTVFKEIPDQQFAAINQYFPAFESELESMFRRMSFVFALNFRAVEDKFSSPAEVIERQVAVAHQLI